MKDCFGSAFSFFLENLALKVSCFWLYIKNFIRQRELIVSDVWCGDAIVLGSNPAQIFWQVSGCHKVTIQNIGTFRGNSCGAEFHLLNYSSVVTLCFYGIKRRVQEDIHLKTVQVDLLDSFKAETKFPSEFKTAYTNKCLIKNNIDILSEEYFLDKIALDKADLKVNISEASISFEPYRQILTKTSNTN